MLSAVYAVLVCLCVCVCVSVCLSVTLRYCIKTAKPRIMAKFERDHRRRWGGLKFVTFDEKRAITRKWYKIDAWFLLKLNRKSYVLYQMAMFPMTLGAS